MFTGLVEGQGKLLAKTAQPGGVRLRLSHSLGVLKLGESIAVSGVCLTVVAFEANSFEVELSSETLELTTLGRLTLGSNINLERAMLPTDRLGGHLVSGHVDATGEVIALTSEGEMTRLRLAVPKSLSAYVAKKGSLTVDGVSLTLNEVHDAEVELLLIPHTQAITTLGELRVGSCVNLEVDLLARYVERILKVRNDSQNSA